MSVLGLDLSLTSTGWSIDATTSGRIRPGKAQVAMGHAWRRRWIAIEVVELVAEHQPDVVVIEGLPSARALAAGALGMLHGVVLERLVLNAGVKPAFVSVSTLKKYATGNGNASKELMVAAACTHLGLTNSSDDEADARWLALIGMHLKGWQPLLDPQRLSLLAGVFWPEGRPDL